MGKLAFGSVRALFIIKIVSAQLDLDFGLGITICVVV